MNEFDFIRLLREQIKSREHSERIVVGIGDDTAVITQVADRDLLSTTDLLVENVDFRRDSAPPQLLGHKALAVSLSDIAAMGARPRWSLVSIGLPKDAWNSDYQEKLMSGYLALADRFGVTLAGGDVSESSKIVIDSIVLGETRTGGAVLRSTARPGDQIFVTGTLGGAAAGLKLIGLGARADEGGRQQAAEGGNRSEDSDEASIQALLLRQLAPEPRVGWGIVLGEERLATAMIDISDGLSSDLHHLCTESNVGATLDAASLPLDENVKHLCGRRALDPLALAFHGGEDFELLFTVAPQNVAGLPKRVDGIPVSRIGEVTDQAGNIHVREKNRQWPLQPQGFTHFTRRKS